MENGQVLTLTGNTIQAPNDFDSAVVGASAIAVGAIATLSSDTNQQSFEGSS